MDELVNSNRWPGGGMVDTRDSKSLIFGCASSSLARATNLYSLQILNQDKTPDLESKAFVQNYVNIKWKKERPEITDRITSDRLIESDLFHLRVALPKIFALKDKIIKFKNI